MGRSILIPLHDRRRSVEDVEEIREILDRLGELAFHYAPIVLDHSLAELTTAGVGEVDLDAEERELQARDEIAELRLSARVPAILEPVPGTPEWELRDEARERLGVPPASVGAPVLSLDLARELQRVRADVGERVGVDRFEVSRPSSFRDHAEEIAHHRSLDLLRAASSPIAGRDGWRRTPDGREWYSAEWLGLVS